MKKKLSINALLCRALSIWAAIFMVAALVGCNKKVTEPGDPIPADGQDNHTAAPPKIRKVLFIGIDGCLWSVFSAANTPHIKGLMDSGYVSTNALAEVPTWSAVGWSGLLTGTSVTAHKAYDNSFSGADYVNNPSFFKQIKDSYPSYRTGSIVTWAPINNNIVNSNDIGFKLNPGNDGATEQTILNELAVNDPGVLFCHFDDVDHAGHATGFSASNEAYVNAVKATDTRIGHILERIRQRKTYENENWLIVVASDHGGAGNTHGGDSYAERNSFIILKNKAITPAQVSKTPTTIVQVQQNEVKALNFGQNIYGVLPSLSLDADAGFTIGFRVRSTINTSDPVILGNKNWASGYNKGIIIANRNGTIRFNLGDGVNRADVDGVNLSDGYWHYVFARVNRENQTAAIFDGGKKVAEKSIGQLGSFQSGQAFRMGQDITETYNPFFSGNISGISVFNSALSDATIAANTFSDIAANHPDYTRLVFYVTGRDGAGSKYQGSAGSRELDVRVKGSAVISWLQVNTPVFIDAPVDYHGAPRLYDVAPTILKFLGIAKPQNYSGNSIINF